MIDILFFASLREQLDCDKLSLPADSINSISNLKAQLITSHPDWENYLNNSTLLYAINSNIVNEEHLVVDGDEVAIFPPVTGG